MTDYYLYNLNLKKIDEISSLKEKFGLKPIKLTSRDNFISDFNTNFWTKEKEFKVKIHIQKYPILISTLNTKKIELKDEPNFGLIKKIVEIVECKNICNFVKEDLDMSIFN